MFKKIMFQNIFLKNRIARFIRCSNNSLFINSMYCIKLLLLRNVFRYLLFVDLIIRYFSFIFSFSRKYKNNV